MYFITWNTWNEEKGEHLFSSKTAAMSKACKIIKKYVRWNSIIQELRSANCPQKHLNYINDLWNDLGNKENDLDLTDELPRNARFDKFEFALTECGTNVDSKDADEFQILYTNFFSGELEIPLFWNNDQLYLELVDFENCDGYEYVDENGEYIQHHRDTFDAFVALNIISKGKHFEKHSLSYVDEESLKSKGFKRHLAKLSMLGYEMYKYDSVHHRIPMSEDDFLFSDKKKYIENTVYGLSRKEHKEHIVDSDYKWGGTSYTLLVYEILNNATGPLLQREIIDIIKEKYGRNIPIVRSTVAQAIKNLQSEKIGCQIEHTKDGYRLIKE